MGLPITLGANSAEHVQFGRPLEHDLF